MVSDRLNMKMRWSSSRSYAPSLGVASTMAASAPSTCIARSPSVRCQVLQYSLPMLDSGPSTPFFTRFVSMRMPLYFMICTPT